MRCRADRRRSAVSTAIQLKSAWWLAVFGATTFGNPVSAQGLLNAPCAVSNSSALLIKDYKTIPPLPSAAATTWRRSCVARTSRRRQRLHDARLVDGQRQGRWRDQLLELGSAIDLEPTNVEAALPGPKLREAHSTPVTNMVGDDWRTWVLRPLLGSRSTISTAWPPGTVTDLHDPRQREGRCRVSSDLRLELRRLVRRGAYDYDEGAVWFIALAAPYLYVAQAANGLNIYKFTNPANAASITWVKRYDVSWFGHRVNQFWVRGNLGIAAAVQANYGVTIVDLERPRPLVKLKQLRPDHVAADPQRLCLDLERQRLYAATKAQTGGLVAGLAVYDIDPVSLRF